MPVDVREPFLLGIDQDSSSHALESLGFHCGRDKCRVRPEVKSHIGAIPAVVLKQEGARQKTHKILQSAFVRIVLLLNRKLLAGVTNELLLPYLLLCLLG